MGKEANLVQLLFEINGDVAMKTGLPYDGPECLLELDAVPAINHLNKRRLADKQEVSCSNALFQT